MAENRNTSHSCPEKVLYRYRYQHWHNGRNPGKWDRRCKSCKTLCDRGPCIYGNTGQWIFSGQCYSRFPDRYSCEWRLHDQRKRICEGCNRMCKLREG